MTDNKNVSVPEIRFNGYNDAWVQRKLGEVAEFLKGNGYSKSDLTDKGTPIILYGRLYTNYETVIKNIDTFAEIKGNSVISYGGEVIVPSSGETAEDISRASVVSESGVILGGDLNIVKANSVINSTFLAITISNGNQQKELSKRAQGKSVVHLNNSDLKSVMLKFPFLPEQIAIGKFFRTLDDTITLCKRKLDGLKKLKTAYLQQMFPKSGERAPRVRFAGFSGEWEQRKFGDLYKRISERNDLTYGTDKIISVANMHFKKDANIDNPEYLKTYNVFKVGDIAFEGNKSKHFKYGRFVENTIGDGIVSHVFIVLRPIVKFDLWFWKYAINSERLMGKILARSTKSSTMMTDLVSADFLNEFFLVPCIKEQEQIGNFFRNLDEQIKSQQTKLKQLQQLKSAYLKKMFV